MRTTHFQQLASLDEKLQLIYKELEGMRNELYEVMFGSLNRVFHFSVNYLGDHRGLDEKQQQAVERTANKICGDMEWVARIYFEDKFHCSVWRQNKGFSRKYPDKQLRSVVSLTRRQTIEVCSTLRGNIHSCVRQSLTLAQLKKKVVTLKFSDIMLEVRPNSSQEKLIEYYFSKKFD